MGQFLAACFKTGIKNKIKKMGWTEVATIQDLSVHLDLGSACIKRVIDQKAKCIHPVVLSKAALYFGIDEEKIFGYARRDGCPLSSEESNQNTKKIQEDMAVKRFMAY